MRNTNKLIGALSILLSFPVVGHCQSTDQVLTFLKEAGCTQLPIGTCELLDADNARGIFAAHKYFLLTAYCGTGNFSQAKQLYSIGEAEDPIMCGNLLGLWGL